MGLGLIIQGVGALAGAYGSYKVGKESNRIAKEQLAYEKTKDTNVANRQAQAQAELDGAMYSVYGTKKKKAKQESGSLSNAYDLETA